MIDSLHIDLEEVDPPYSYSDKAPANCAYRAPSMNADCWKAKTCRITLQRYNAKHALAYFLEIVTDRPRWVKLRVLHPDIFGIYALQQGLQLHYRINHPPILRLERDHYGFAYCPEGTYYVHVSAGTTVMGVYAVDIDWFKRYQHSYLCAFKTLLEKAGDHADRYAVLGPLPMHALISDEWLLLASLPVDDGLKMDSAVYRPLATLLHVAQADLLAGQPKTHLLADRLEVVKHHIAQLGLHAAPFSVALVAGHFGFSQRHLIREFRLAYHITPKQYYLAVHLGECRRLLRDKHMTVKEVAYQRGYADVRHFIRQYKKQFGKRPGDH